MTDKEEIKSQISWMEEDLRNLKEQLNYPLYKHYKNGKSYIITGKCMIQVDNEWIDAVIYKEEFDNELYCRSVIEFSEKFKLEE